MLKFIIVEFISFFFGVGAFHMFKPTGFVEITAFGVITGIVVGVSCVYLIIGDNK